MPPKKHSTPNPKIKKNTQDYPQLLTVLTGLAQELDAPLRSVSRRSQNLIQEYKDKNFEYVSYKDFKTIIQTLETINRQLQRCCDTTGRMMNVYKQKGHLKNQTSQVNDVVKEIIALASQQMELLRIKIKAKLTPNLPLVKLDPVECHQVINNVLMNAMQSMPAGGVIRISTKYNASKRMVEIDIIDEGVGITPEHLSHVFEPFFTTKERGTHKSSGLGLSIVHSIVTTIGGGVEIQSSLRKGTQVRVSLPAV